MIRFLKILGLALLLEVLVYGGVALAARHLSDSLGGLPGLIGAVLHPLAVVYTLISPEPGRTSVYFVSGVLQWLVLGFIAVAICDRAKENRANKPLQGTPAKAPSSSTEPEGRRS